LLFKYSEIFKKQMTKKKTYEEVKELFSQRGYELLEKEYKDNKQRLEYKCKCGNISKISVRRLDSRIACKKCSRENRRKTTQEKYGVNNVAQLETVQKKMKETIAKKCKENPLRNKTVQEKRRKTCEDKYGVDHPVKTKEIKEKIRQVWNEKYGVDHPFQLREIREKSEMTFLEKYGSKNPLQNEEIKQKSRQTCKKRYGFPHPMQNPKIHQKMLRTAFGTKTYTFPSGTTVEVQGYEPFCLDELLSTQECTEEDLLQGYERIPAIPYTFQGQKHYYHPDIFIPSSNRIIEVKSDYTLEKEYEKNMAKFSACKDLGLRTEIRCYDYLGNISCLIY